MRKFAFFYLFISLIVLTGCESAFLFGKNAKKEARQKETISNISSGISSNNIKKIDKIATFAAGTDYSLNKLTNDIPEVKVALELNDRVISLAGSPNISDLKMIQSIVDGLLSENQKNRDEAHKLLAVKDLEIQGLQDKNAKLLSDKEREIKKYMDSAAATAMQTDTYKADLDKMDSYFGLGAVFYGLKKFLFSSTIFLVIILVVFLLLRGFAASNPIVGAVFSVFETMVSWIIHSLRALAPKAIKVANLVPKATFDGYKQTLDKIIDTFELLKQKQKVATKTYTLEELSQELSKNLSDDDKARVEECKKDLKW